MGSSTLKITPNGIELSSLNIDVDSSDLTLVEGGLVKINSGVSISGKGSTDVSDVEAAPDAEEFDGFGSNDTLERVLAEKNAESVFKDVEPILVADAGDNSVTMTDAGTNTTVNEESALLTNPTSGGIRNDAHGYGHFGASRGSRKHTGIDLAATTGQSVVSPVDGVAVNFTGATTGYPIVDITPTDKSLGIDKIRLLYADAPSGVSSWSSYPVSAGQSVGSVADLQSLGYSSGVTPHIHVQVMSNGKWVDPTPYFFAP